MASSSSAPNAANVNEETTTPVKRTATALGHADPAPPVKRRRLTSFASPLPSSVKAAAASSRWVTSPSPSAGKTLTAPRARAVRGTRTPTIRAAAWSAASVKAAAASRASRSAGKTVTPAVRGTLSKNLNLNFQNSLVKKNPNKSFLDEVKDDRISSSLSKIKEEATEGRDTTATFAASVLQGASIFDSVIRNTRYVLYCIVLYLCSRN